MADPAFEPAALAASVGSTLYDGPKSIRGRIEEMNAFEQVAMMNAQQRDAHNAEYTALKLADDGGPTLAARVADLENLLLTAMLSPAQDATVRLELDTLRIVAKDFGSLSVREASLKGAPDAADQLEAQVLSAFFERGYHGVEARIGQLEHLKTVARLNEAGLRAVDAELTVLRALATGVPSVTAKREELYQLSTVARLDESASLKLQLELDVLGRIEAAFAHFKGGDTEPMPTSGAR